MKILFTIIMLCAGTFIMGCRTTEGDPSYNFCTNTQILIDHAMKEDLISVDLMEMTPDYKKPVYHVAHGEGADHSRKIVVMFCKKEGVPETVELIDAIATFARTEVAAFLQSKGHLGENIESNITLDTFKEMLAWSIQFNEEKNGELTTYYYTLDYKTGEVLNKHKTPED